MYYTSSEDFAQIEQFIESIFPSQDPQALILEAKNQPVPKAPAQTEKDASMEEAKWDTSMSCISMFAIVYAHGSFSLPIGGCHGNIVLHLVHHGKSIGNHFLLRIH